MEDTICKKGFYAYMLRVDVDHSKAIKLFTTWREKYNCAYWIIGLEHGDQTGKQHIQGIVWFEGLQKMAKLRNWFRDKVNKTTQPVAFTSAKKITNLAKYCLKDGNYETNLTKDEIEKIGKWNVGDGSDYTFMSELYKLADSLCPTVSQHAHGMYQEEFVHKLLGFYRLKGKRPSKSTMDYILFKYNFISNERWYDIHYTTKYSNY